MKRRAPILCAETLHIDAARGDTQNQVSNEARFLQGGTNSDHATHGLGDQCGRLIDLGDYFGDQIINAIHFWVGWSRSEAGPPEVNFLGRVGESICYGHPQFGSA